jgi:hypothetical protein
MVVADRAGRGRLPSQKSLTLMALTSIPALSMMATRSSIPAPLTRSSNGVPLTMLAGTGMSQWQCTSMTRTRRPPIMIWRRAGGACSADETPPRPMTYKPAVAPATVLKKSLRLAMTLPNACLWL